MGYTGIYRDDSGISSDGRDNDRDTSMVNRRVLGRSPRGVRRCQPPTSYRQASHGLGVTRSSEIRVRLPSYANAITRDIPVRGGRRAASGGAHRLRVRAVRRSRTSARRSYELGGRPIDGLKMQLASDGASGWRMQASATTSSSAS